MGWKMEIDYKGKIEINKKQIKNLESWIKRWLKMNGLSPFIGLKTEDLGDSLVMTFSQSSESSDGDDEEE